MRPTDDTDATDATRRAARDAGGPAHLVEANPSSNDAADEDEPAGAARGTERGAASSRVIDALPGSPHLWATVCVCCLIVSAALMLNGRAEAAFVTATLGVLAWFINVRNGLRGDDGASERGGEDEKKRLRDS